MREAVQPSCTLTYMKFCIWGQGKVGQVGVILVRRLNGDSICASRRLQRESLTARWNTRDSLKLCLELGDGPRGSDSALRLREFRNDDERDVGHGFDSERRLAGYAIYRCVDTVSNSVSFSWACRRRSGNYCKTPAPHQK
jgi:hypothetical protein